MNNETRELLTLAAKATGFEYIVTGTEQVIRRRIRQAPDDTTTWPVWNPLTSADDLVGLMCAVKPSVNHYGDAVSATHYDGDGFLKVELLSDHNNDRRAALAMVVLRVAAEIGERMK